MTSQLALSPDAAVDLHMHTRYSDGRWRPAELFDTLAQRGFRVVSVVDHDQLAHVPEVMALGIERSVINIPGAEVTTEWRGLAAHLLCYAPLPDGFTSGALGELIDDTRERMLTNTRAIYDALLAHGYRFPRQAEVLADRDGQLQRALDVEDLLKAYGYASSPTEATRMVAEAGYQQMLAPIQQAVEAAHASGALCLLAHPGRGEGEIHRYEPTEIEALLAEVPLDGVEVYYPTHTPEQVAEYAALAERHGLLVSAGSDSHGPDHRMPIAYPARQIAPLLERLGVTVG